MVKWIVQLLVSSFLGRLWEKLAARIFISTERKLGQTETVNQQQANVINRVSHAKRINDINEQLTADALRLQTRQFQRPDE